jgi:hypothetical protein
MARRPPVRCFGPQLEETQVGSAGNAAWQTTQPGDVQMAFDRHARQWFVIGLGLIGCATGYLLALSDSPVVGIALPLMFGLVGAIGGVYAAKGDQSSDHEVRLTLIGQSASAVSLGIVLTSLGVSTIAYFITNVTGYDTVFRSGIELPANWSPDKGVAAIIYLKTVFANKALLIEQWIFSLEQNKDIPLHTVTETLREIEKSVETVLPKPRELPSFVDNFNTITRHRNIVPSLLNLRTALAENQPSLSLDEIVIPGNELQSVAKQASNKLWFRLADLIQRLTKRQ